LEPTVYMPCGEVLGRGRGRVYAFRLVRGGFVEGREAVEVCCIEDCADAILCLALVDPRLKGCVPCVRHQRRQYLFRYEAPSLSPYSM
jgi:hypothetical protein